MESIYLRNRNEIIKLLKVIWEYMKLDQKIEKCDIIIACGCSNLEIPIKCCELIQNQYASKVIFSGGLGKITVESNTKTEGETYKDIAIQNGLSEECILIETKSTNTADNFKFSKKILDKQNIKYESILIVHKPLVERRTFLCAKKIFPNKRIMITSPYESFEEYISYLEKSKYIDDEISIIVGDIQRIAIYPQFGWQVDEKLSKTVIDTYFRLKKLGFTKYIVDKEKIKKLIKEYGILEGYKKNYFN